MLTMNMKSNAQNFELRRACPYKYGLLLICKSQVPKKKALAFTLLWAAKCLHALMRVAMKIPPATVGIFLSTRSHFIAEVDRVHHNTHCQSLTQTKAIVTNFAVQGKHILR